MNILVISLLCVFFASPKTSAAKSEAVITKSYADNGLSKSHNRIKHINLMNGNGNISSRITLEFSFSSRVVPGPELG